MVGFWDAITSFLPESLIKVDTTIIDKRVIFSGNKITIGDKEITDPKIMQRISDEISKYKEKDSLPFQVLHKDLEEDYIQTEEVSLENKIQLRILKQILPSEEIECILMARRISLAFKKNDKPLITRLMDQLDKKYPLKGRKVNNLISAGYFDELILPMIEIYKSQDSINYGERFCKFYYDLLRFFPTAIFVNSNTSREKIELEILKRFRLKRIPYIKIHAMGIENINKVERVLDKFESDKSVIINNNKFTHPSLGLNCQIVEIRIQKNLF